MISNWEKGSADFWQNLLWLSLSTIGLYAGGVAFNDIADAELDAVERPERPIPSGRASKSTAIIFATSLLVFGVAMAFLVNWIAGVLAIGVSLCALM